jgi:hypothetical protein
MDWQPLGFVVAIYLGALTATAPVLFVAWRRARRDARQARREFTLYRLGR